MATTPSRRPNCSGGKIVKNKRLSAASRTPYVRPPQRAAPSEDLQNPNWLSGLIYPAKMIASGAGKIISFFGSDYSSSSSSGADSSENDDDEEEEEGVENDTSSQGYTPLDKVLSPSSKSDDKRAIEQLVMQETFSREEANKLVKLIKSRVVDTNGAFDETTPNVRTTAIMEARKWLQEKRSGSKKKLESELDVSNVASPSHVTRNEKGSPVDMAKSYMQNRPTWESSSLKQVEFGSPSPSGMQHFKEETPKSILGASELKRSSFTSGSWNLLEEIRRVRSKATEELLAATPLTKTIISSFSSESNPPQDSLTNRGGTEGAGPAEATHGRPENILPDTVVGYPSRDNQDGDAVRSVEHQECQEAAEMKSSKYDEVTELRSIAAENGFVSSASGLVQAPDATQEPRPSEEENGNVVGSSQEETDVHMEENVNLQHEPSTDIPTANPSETLVNGSGMSSSMQQEELPQLSLPIVEQSSRAKAEGTPKERKSRGYTRRGRGRGRAL